MEVIRHVVPAEPAQRVEEVVCGVLGGLGRKRGREHREEHEREEPKASPGDATDYREPGWRAAAMRSTVTDHDE